jgi:hypothetical protein
MEPWFLGRRALISNIRLDMVENFAVPPLVEEEDEYFVDCVSQ